MILFMIEFCALVKRSRFYIKPPLGRLIYDDVSSAFYLILK